LGSKDVKQSDIEEIGQLVSGGQTSEWSVVGLEGEVGVCVASSS
jgi:hypothetical protein